MSRDLSRRSLLAGSVATVLAAGLAACADDDDSAGTATTETGGRYGPGPTETTAAGEDLDLPPNDSDALIEMFNPLFAPLGQHVVRAGLYDLDAGFVRDDGGTHLALYVEPIDPEGVGWDMDRYIDSVVPGVAASTPFAFDRWADLLTFDVCQEPPQADNPEPEPPIETQILLSRADASLIDWEDVTLADLIAGKLRSPDTMRVAARPEVQEHPRWRAAEEEAEGLV